MRRLFPLLLPLLLAFDAGTPVKVQVVDVDGRPIPTAVVRHPDEIEHHRHSSVVPVPWIASVLYLRDGTELVFEPGLVLQLEVSAPGYVSQRFTHRVRKRRKRNEVEVVLEKLTLETAPRDGPVIQFGRGH